MANIWKPTNYLRWFKKEKNVVSNPAYLTMKLQQLWVDDMGNQEWRDISEE
jgi:hypothetical protein